MTKVSEMLENPNIRKWYDDFIYNNSESTAIVYLRRLSAILKSMGETPDSILKLDKNTLYDKTFSYAKEEKMKGRTPSYIVSEFKSIYSYLRNMDVDFKRIPSPKNAKSTPTVQDEQIPTRDELSNLIQIATPRDKISICLMAFSGIRPGVIGDIHGEKGLQMGDLDGWKILNGEIKFKTAIMITIQPELSKTSNKYITFLCEEGARHLKNYIDSRIRNGEKITKKSPVVRSIFEKKTDYIGTNAIRNGIRISMRKIGIEKRPYVLRRYFITRLQEAEHRGLIIHSYNQFFMGHSGDMMATYTINKGLTDTQLDDMREAYQRSKKFLQTDIAQEEIEKTQARMREIENKSEEIETKSENIQDMFLDQISKLKNENQELRVVIDTLVKDRQEVTNFMKEFYEQKEGKMNTVIVKK